MIPTIKPLPASRAKTPSAALGARPAQSSEARGAPCSSKERAVTAREPRTVPRMVCGRRNFQKAWRKAGREEALEEEEGEEEEGRGGKEAAPSAAAAVAVGRRRGARGAVVVGARCWGKSCFLVIGRKREDEEGKRREEDE